MSVYAVFEVVLADPMPDEARARYDRYRSHVSALIEAHGGRYLARAAAGAILEQPGDAAPGSTPGSRWHLVEFPNAAAAEAFWRSDDYRALRPLRIDAVEVRAVLIDPDRPAT